MEDITTRDQNSHPTPHYKEQFSAAMLVAARKVEKKDKEETPTEMFVRNSRQGRQREQECQDGCEETLEEEKAQEDYNLFC
jgi:hypothetical protein